MANNLVESKFMAWSETCTMHSARARLRGVLNIAEYFMLLPHLYQHVSASDAIKIDGLWTG